MNWPQKAISKLDKAITDVDQAIRDQIWVREKDITEIQLIEIKNSLGKMRIILKGDTPLESAKNTTRMGRVIADSWPVTFPLGETVLAAEHAFLKAINTNDE